MDVQKNGDINVFVLPLGILSAVYFKFLCIDFDVNVILVENSIFYFVIQLSKCVAWCCIDCLQRQTRTFCLLKFVCLVDSYNVSISSQVKHTALEYIYAIHIGMFTFLNYLMTYNTDILLSGIHSTLLLLLILKIYFVAKILKHCLLAWQKWSGIA